MEYNIFLIISLSMYIENKIQHILKFHGADFVHFVDISKLSEKENKGYPNALLFGIVLSPSYLQSLNSDKDADLSEFSSKEEKVGEMADVIAQSIFEKGYSAYSQSDHNIYSTGYYEEEIKTTPLPHKTIASLGGLGWIGKNNLLTTRKYGSAFSMCSILTNIPLETISCEPVPSKCGTCKICQNICPAKVIKGNTWKPGTVREHLVDVYHCIQCLKCMAACPYTKSFFNRHLENRKRYEK